jgi:hypothetical protein
MGKTVSMLPARDLLNRWWQRRGQRAQHFRDTVAARPLLSALAGAGFGAILSVTSALIDPVHSSGVVTSLVGGAIGGFLGCGAVVLLLLWIRKSRDRRDGSRRTL